MKNFYRMFAVMLCILLCITAAVTPVSAAEGAENINDFSKYIKLADELASFEFDELSVEGEFTLKEDYISINGDATVSVSIPNTVKGKAVVGLTYRIADSYSRNVSLAAELNGEALGSFDLSHLYTYALDEKKMDTDDRGNDVQPKQVTLDGFWTLPLRQTNHLAGENFVLELGADTNVLKLTFKGVEVEIKAVSLHKCNEISAYKSVSGDAAKDAVRIEAEYPSAVSSDILYPIADRGDPETAPSDAALTRLNTIGGSNWNKAGQWISWEFEIKEAGYYRISARVRQNVTRGMRSLRRIMIDGEVPCKELEEYAFSYDRDWQTVTLKNASEDMLFYFDKGIHTITMEAVMGDGTAIYETLEDTVKKLNELYLKIIKITGTSPDTYRTYNLDKVIPGLTEDMTALANTLDGIIKDYQKLTGASASELAFINEVTDLLRRYIKDSDVIITTLSTFNSDISTLSTLLNTLCSQPLQIDAITLSGEPTTLRAKASLWERFCFGLKQFIYSFAVDYQSFGTSDGDGAKLDVWITTGRDQANLMKSMIDESFTPKTSTRVELSLVAAGIVEAIMAGRGPDVVIGAPRTYPMDLGARGVLTAMNDFDGFKELRGRFQQNAFNAYTYNGKVYGIPETSDFLMMFVRTDVFESLGLSIPETWDDFLHLSTVLAQDNLSVGIPITSIGTRLVQSGLTYYNKDFSATTLSSEKAYEVYSSFIKLYTDYEQPFAYNPGNRFKTGEMPIVIDYLSFYSTISVLAPEIRDSWAMYPIPATVLQDGSRSNASDAMGTANIILNSCKETKAAFEFISWWTSADSQEHYGHAIENILGDSGRYLTANTEAISRLDWTDEQLKAILAQQKTVCDIPEIPGSYIITRNIQNIFYDIINNGAVVRESLLRYSDIIDAELESKKAEMERLNK